MISGAFSVRESSRYRQSRRQAFPGMPNRIEVDSHYRFTGDADFIARDLALRIESVGRGGRIVGVDADNDATRVKTNSFLSPRSASLFLPVAPGNICRPMSVSASSERSCGDRLDLHGSHLR